ncbi:hypothetical protein LEP1GSC137_0385 [Leptospira borgpetersenii str. Noumea 25]|uniref:Uncharacterized protein n=1 Tax=Leptospira borgpetersenii serovar Ballum TaxID=280505 RepID=A0A0S2IXU8_LEPBO|nr:hypothetical protein LBBP_04333 [Leptospira borgpetersenii serovar Ballum]ALO28490.1 hypothetical protein LBBP_04381 [Leptospira borgpetersenii serovar Ballum]EKR01152.1 hypothetical protein LEP1GSC121_1665 [Leptospira borgpetersenii serovar Castellonis str. 200801910]EMO11774.1 hypothetical protein LEP1GSC137_0385 [Leptospira borgpetersenii str. Noumea 25]
MLRVHGAINHRATIRERNTFISSADLLNFIESTISTNPT